MPETLTNWTKFCVWFKVEDNDTWNLISSKCQENSHKFSVDEMLTILVNVAHSLAVDSGKLFDVANVEFLWRLKSLDKLDYDLTIKTTDWIKILSILNSYKRLDE